MPALRPRPYDITVGANGFKTVHRNGVMLEADQKAQLDFALISGSGTESTTVDGSTPLNT